MVISEIISAALIVLIITLGPKLVMLLAEKVKFFGLLGPVFLCYALGLALSFVFGALRWDTSLAMDIAEVMVPIAIPLILFGADLRSVRHLAKPTLISFLLVILSVFIVSCSAFLLLRSRIPDAAGLSGMLIGLYTGGTPNLMAIGKALNVSDTTIALANASDVAVGGLYFFILIAIGPIIARSQAKKAAAAQSTDESKLADELKKQYTEGDKAGFFRRIPAVLLAVLCLAVGAGASILITGQLTNIVVIMLAVTTLGIALSFIKGVRTAPGTYSSGQYFIYMFSVGIGLSLDLSSLGAGALTILIFVAAVQFASVALHVILASICRISAPTTVITSVAGVFGPAFIVPVANAMDNREVVLPGLICGILGYAVGNYLGIGTAMLLSLL